jgi:hypothetical protein
MVSVESTSLSVIVGVAQVGRIRMCKYYSILACLGCRRSACIDGSNGYGGTVLHACYLAFYVICPALLQTMRSLQTNTEKDSDMQIFQLCRVESWICRIPNAAEFSRRGLGCFGIRGSVSASIIGSTHLSNNDRTSIVICGLTRSALFKIHQTTGAASLCG